MNRRQTRLALNVLYHMVGSSTEFDNYVQFCKSKEVDPQDIRGMVQKNHVYAQALQALGRTFQPDFDTWSNTDNSPHRAPREGRPVTDSTMIDGISLQSVQYDANPRPIAVEDLERLRAEFRAASQPIRVEILNNREGMPELTPEDLGTIASEANQYIGVPVNSGNQAAIAQAIEGELTRISRTMRREQRINNIAINNGES